MVLYSFGAKANDGGFPGDLITDASGNFYEQPRLEGHGDSGRYLRSSLMVMRPFFTISQGSMEMVVNLTAAWFATWTTLAQHYGAVVNTNQGTIFNLQRAAAREQSRTRFWEEPTARTPTV